MKRSLIALLLTLLFGLTAVWASVPDTSFSNSYVGDGGTTVFAYTWRLIDPSQMTVEVNGTPQSHAAYTVFQNTNGIGGTVTFNSAPANAASVFIERNSDLLQLNSFANNGAIPLKTLEQMVDKLTIMVQQLNNEVTDSAQFISTDQDITTGGTLTLPHGLGLTPTQVRYALVNQVSQGGYTPGDLVFNPTPTVASFAGWSDLTNIHVAFGDAASSFTLADTSGIPFSITNADWKLRVYADKSTGVTTTVAILPNSGVTAGAYTNANITVNAKGIVTNLASGSGGGSGGAVDDVTAADSSVTVTPNDGHVTVKLPTSGVSAGSYTFSSVTVNNKGIVTGISNGSPPVPAKFTSTDQVISNAGALTLPHSLGVTPTLIYYALVCQTTQAGYGVGEVVTSTCSNGSLTQGVAFTADATNVNVIMVNASSPFTILNKTTGAPTVLTNANWKIRVYAAP